MPYGDEDPLRAFDHDPDKTSGRVDSKGGIIPFVLLIVVLGLTIGAFYIYTFGRSDLTSDRAGGPDPAAATAPARSGSGLLIPGAANPGKSTEPR
jgi:hypothetical protein